MKKITFLYYNKFWHYDFPDFSKLPVPEGIEILTGKEHIDKADVVIFHVPSLEYEEFKMIQKKKGQLWVYWSFECEAHFPAFETPETKRLFDITTTYRLDSDAPMPYIGPYSKAPWRQEPAKKTGFVNAFFSSDWDLSGRYNYLSELMNHINIDSYGKYFNNIKAVEEDPYQNAGLGPGSFSFKEKIIASYKFTLAFENAIAKDYVTEKLFQPLIMGSVPVYLGAPNVDEFTMGEHCYINVNSFSSVKELAEYLVMLDNNDALFNEYLKWKKLPFKSEFESKINSYPIDSFGKIVTLIRERL